MQFATGYVMRDILIFLESITMMPSLSAMANLHSPELLRELTTLPYP